MSAVPHTISGAGLDVSALGGPVALSKAITLASHCPDEATLYVRDPAGRVYGRVERRRDGSVLVFRDGPP